MATSPLKVSLIQVEGESRYVCRELDLEEFPIYRRDKPICDSNRSARFVVVRCTAYFSVSSGRALFFLGGSFVASPPPPNLKKKASARRQALCRDVNEDLHILFEAVTKRGDIKSSGIQQVVKRGRGWPGLSSGQPRKSSFLDKHCLLESKRAKMITATIFVVISFG